GCKAKEQQGPSPPRVGETTDPRRKSCDDELRHDDAGADQRRCPLARAERQNAAYEREHRRVGKLKQQNTGREYQEPAVAQHWALLACWGCAIGVGGAFDPIQANGAKPPYRRWGKGGSEKKYCLTGDEVAAYAHGRGGKSVADRGEAGVAAEPGP